VKTLIPLLVTLFVTQPTSSPRQIADELLTADRAFAAASAKTNLVTGLSAMFAAEVVLPHPNGLADGFDKAVEALKANPVNAGAKIEWTPARVGISGDGRHGFTAGFMTMHRADGTAAPLKYLAYWERKPEGWRVLAYKRGQARAAPPAMALSYALPQQIVEPSKDAAAVERNRESLAERERAFSRDAQQIGMRAAFTQYGSPDAINLGGPDTPTWLMGNAAIGAGVGGDRPETGSPVSWGPDKTIVAGSGDFGVTIGFIVPNAPGPDGKPQRALPFFTIWRKDGDGVWRYIAE
jgi:ketosteroid isomerase-like protein